jgi:tetratricopeptide (TPR) repeat protein
MSSQTLMYDLVVAQLQGFERLAVDALNQQNFPFLDQYKVPYVKLAPLVDQPPQDAGPVTEPKEVPVQAAAQWPTNLFLDSQGHEIFRIHGYVAGKQFAQMLGQVQELSKHWDLLRQNPNSPAAEAALGHLYLELKVFAESRKHLEHALALDPQNTSGVLPDVQLDLTILALPDDTHAGALALQDWQKRNPHHPRLLEAVYYQAVADVNNGDLGGAVKLLNRFAQAKPGSPETKSEWFVPACSLLAKIQQQQNSH